MRHFSIDVPMVWSCVAEVRRAVAEALEAFPRELRDAAQMTASELLENAIKYGEPVSAAPNAVFELRVGDGQIQLEVRNGTTRLDSVQKVMLRVDELRKAGDRQARQALYVQQFAALLDDPTRPGELGLYRIGFEGEFELGCDYTGEVLKITATRKYDE